MKWILFGTVLALCAVCGLLGLIAGINLNPQSTIKFVPAMGSLGDWIAGIGAIFAVGVAVWQSLLQQQREKAKASITHEYYKEFWCIRLLSEGIVPVTVLSVHLAYNTSKTIDLVVWLAAGAAPPRKLERGDVMTLIQLADLDFGAFARHLADPIIRDLSAEGIAPGDGDFGFDERYFGALKTAGELDAFLLIRTAHGEIAWKVPREVMSELFNTVIETDRGIRLNEINRQKENISEMLSMFQQLETKPRE
ncbi:hypothetical protein LOY49_12505 [Pseudomonas atacamensis]|uniref:hypothetical protein n=1 Tax=Pseudomonas atacamensis TaxID=2565368 RepID=UPI00215EAF3D|nr:hypothetical protein [Pseudomonas atacamensis]UVK96104.1 hypothetical protein LOY49_12505 [Pseudomonas atacamensis]